MSVIFDSNWKIASATAVANIASSVASSTATGYPEVAEAGTQTLIYITNNFLTVDPGSINEQQLADLMVSVKKYERSLGDAGAPQTEIFKLKQDRDTALASATSVGQKADIWLHWLAGFGKAAKDWSSALKPLVGGGD
jgi:hypothetical protein